MSIGNRGRRTKRSTFHAVRLASRGALWQSGTSELGHRATHFRRDRILSRVGLSLTRLRQGARVPAVTPLIVDRLHNPAVVAAHGRQDRSHVWRRGILRHDTAAAKGPITTRCNAIRTDFAPRC
jgi:hypothetical protein